MEKLRAEVRAKITQKIEEIVRREEENAKKQIEEEHEIDEEWMAEIMKKGDPPESPAKAVQSGAAAADGENATAEGEEKRASDHEDGEEEGEEEVEDSLSQIQEESKEIPLMKKKTNMMGGFKGVVEAMKKQISQEKLDSARSSGGGSIKKEEQKGD